MSTKRIREALESLGDGGQFPTSLHKRAIAELEAIERAARVVSAPISSLSEFIEAVEVLERIAKESSSG